MLKEEGEETKKKEKILKKKDRKGKGGGKGRKERRKNDKKNWKSWKLIKNTFLSIKPHYCCHSSTSNNYLLILFHKKVFIYPHPLFSWGCNIQSNPTRISRFKVFCMNSYQGNGVVIY